ncbi:MAG: sensor histidine kinase [Candidatus Riflebacteria bacterium]|nr:sensor histidine kinase [Candidatus Riflebacteria bacterium]
MHWKLVVSYFLVTAISVMSLFYLFLLPIAAKLSKDFSSPEKIRSLALGYLPQFIPLLASSTLDPRMVQAKLEQIMDSSPENPEEPLTGWRLSVEITPGLSVAITNASGTVLAGFPSRHWSLDFPIWDRLTKDEKPLFDLVQQGCLLPGKLQIQDKQKTAFFIPVEDKNGKLIGTAFLRFYLPRSGLDFIRQSLDLVFPLSLFIAFGSGFVGIGAGFFFTRGLMKRFDHIIEVTQTWSKGDFTKRISDLKRDELGDLSDQLNILAGDLDRLFSLKQRLISASERNRIARDLHDTVKQHIFALSMQIKAVQVLEKDAPELIQRRFKAIDDLIQQIQRDLRGIIQDLSISENIGKTGLDLFTSFIRDWEKTTGIKAALTVDLDLTLPSSIDHILYPILQEAFSNILQHSHATLVSIRLEKNETGFSLEICDNGQGFDTAAAVTGMGLKNLLERGCLLPGGAMAILSQPGQGTTLKFSWSEGV